MGSRLRILIVDDEQAFGSLLGRTLRRMGHEPIVVNDPSDALAAADRSIDAVITDIDMPAMTGVELARLLRRKDESLPIAFCTGSVPDHDVLREAQEIGSVLPKVWSVAQVRSVVEELARAVAGRPSPRAAEPPSAEGTAPGRIPIKIKITCPTWDAVRRLAEARSAGTYQPAFRGTIGVMVGDPVAVALALPGELVLALTGSVAEVHAVDDGPEADCLVELDGLDHELCGRLRAMASADGRPVVVGPRARVVRGSDPRIARPPRATTPPEETGELVHGNVQLRTQIESLADRMRPRTPGKDEQN